jgi:hypothetical protein
VYAWVPGAVWGTGRGGAVLFGEGSEVRSGLRFGRVDRGGRDSSFGSLYRMMGGRSVLMRCVLTCGGVESRGRGRGHEALGEWGHAGGLNGGGGLDGSLGRGRGSALPGRHDHGASADASRGKGHHRGPGGPGLARGDTRGRGGGDAAEGDNVSHCSTTVKRLRDASTGSGAATR